jgi:hypothetical protein
MLIIRLYLYEEKHPSTRGININIILNFKFYM